MKNSSTVVLCLGIVLLLAWQVNASTTTISLSEAIQYALQESIDCKIAQIEWENGQIAYQKAMADNLLTQSTYNQGLAELNLQKADAAYKKSIAGVLTSAVRHFTDVELARMDLKIQEQQLRLSEKALELTQRKVKAQNASEYDLLQAEAALAKSQISYQKDKDSLEEKQQAFSLLINSDTMIPDGKLEFVPFTVDLAQVLPEVLQSSVKLKEAKDSLELAKLDLERLLLEETADLVLQDARNQVALADLKLQQVQANTVQEVRSAFNAVKQAEQAYKASCLSHELEKKQYQITKGQVDAGLKTEDDLLRAQTSLWEAERSVYEALTGQIINYLQFDEVIGKDVRTSQVLPPMNMEADD
jgi:outer membrane protein TolC